MEAGGITMVDYTQLAVSVGPFDMPGQGGREFPTGTPKV